MHNAFITELLDWAPTDPPGVAQLNGLLARSGVGARVVTPGRTGIMQTVETRMNIFHLLSQVLAYEVPGAVVELGTYEGQTAVLLARVLQEMAPDRELHCYDIFDLPETRRTLEGNFLAHGLPLPTLHEGMVQQTIPTGLPATICFAHLDMASTPDSPAHDAIAHGLAHVYPRLASGGILLINEYVNPTVLPVEEDPWPEYRAAADAFFADKPEDVSVLYAGRRSQGYVRKR